MTNTSPDNYVDWKLIQVAIFDVDGTLYCQRALRRKMIKELCRFYFRHPSKVYELKILRDFRNAREVGARVAVDDLDNMQYVWGAERSGVKPERVRRIVFEWILRRPLKYLLTCRYPGVVEFLNRLRQKGIKVVFLSDYPVADKLNALELSSELSVVATDPKIGRFKPDPKGVLHIAQTLGVRPEDCVVIGDRDDRDGEVARRAGMWYIIIGKHRSRNQRSYPELSEELNFSSARENL